MARATNLYRLQEVDLALHQTESRLEEIEAILRDSEALRSSERNVEEAQSELVSARSSVGSAEQAVAAQRDKMEKTEQALYGGSVQNPKELQELQMEAASLKRHMANLEDRLLEGMLALEEAEDAYDLAKRDFELVEAQVGAQNKQLADEREALLGKLERLSVEREAALANVSPEDLELYQRLRKSLGPRVVAEVDEGVCAACGMTLPASQRQTIRTGSDLVRCSQCGRVLYAG